MERAIVTLGLPQDIDPAKALLDEISRTYGNYQGGELDDAAVNRIVSGIEVAAQEYCPEAADQ